MVLNPENHFKLYHRLFTGNQTFMQQ